MKITHIIPSAFDYFDDIQSQAFLLVESLNQLGVESDAITLQYSAISQKKEKEMEAKSPSRRFAGLTNITEALTSLEGADLVHLHAPFMGAASKILSWKKKYTKIPLIISYYRRVEIIDAFSVIISFYNNYYLRKLFSTASFICAESLESFKTGGGYFLLKAKDKFVAVDQSENFMGVNLTRVVGDKVQLTKQEIRAMKFLMIYEEVLSKL